MFCPFLPRTGSYPPLVVWAQFFAAPWQPFTLRLQRSFDHFSFFHSPPAIWTVLLLFLSLFILTLVLSFMLPPLATNFLFSHVFVSTRIWLTTFFRTLENLSLLTGLLLALPCNFRVFSKFGRYSFSLHSFSPFPLDIVEISGSRLFQGRIFLSILSSC